jgi:hypothetical protein
MLEWPSINILCIVTMCKTLLRALLPIQPR